MSIGIRSDVKNFDDVRKALGMIDNLFGQRIDELMSVGSITITGTASTVVSRGAEKFVFCPESCTLTLPLARKNRGRIYHVIRTGSPGAGNNVTIEASGDDLINDESSVVIQQQDASLSFIGTGAEWRIF